jgi:hypothetical protein
MSCLTSCGADKFKPQASAAIKSSLNMPVTCGCNSTYSPVCGVDGRSYDNSCIAECKQIVVSKVGNCICSETLKVCGVDEIDYSECEADRQKIDIKKYVPCAAQEI